MNGIALRWNAERSIGAIRGEDGQSYLALDRQIEADDIGRQFLIPGERVEFYPTVNPRGGRRPMAAQIVTPDRPPVEVDDAYKEEVTIISWNHSSYGWARRPLGGPLLCHKDEVVTEGAETLGIGSRLWVKPAPPLQPGQAWRAVEIEIFE